MNFIFKELERISEKLSKNENINVLYSEKNTKFGKLKYNFTNINEILPEKKEKKSIVNGWLIQRFNKGIMHL